MRGGDLAGSLGVPAKTRSWLVDDGGATDERHGGEYRLPLASAWPQRTATAVSAAVRGIGIVRGVFATDAVILPSTVPGSSVPEATVTTSWQ